MFVNTGLLHSGATASDRAGKHSQTGADRLSSAGLLSGMFGDFDAADEFHDALGVAHTHYVSKLRGHQEMLGDIGGKARTAAAAFTTMEEHNAALLKAAGWVSNT